MKVSVIIPTYNRAELLPQALESVFAQQGIELEVIVIDDASTDGTRELLASYQDERLKVIHHPTNRGGGAARNTGIATASGELIAFLDSDDLWRAGKLAKQVALFCADKSTEESKPLGVVYTGYHKHKGRPNEQKLRQGDLFPEILVENFIGTTSTVLTQKNYLEQVGGFDVELPSCQDWDLWIRLAKHYRFDCLQEPLVDYHRRADSISNNPQATRNGHQQLMQKHAADLQLLSPKQRGRCYFNLGRVFWWKREPEAARWFGRAISEDISQLRALYQLLIANPLKKRFTRNAVDSSSEPPKVLHLIEHLHVGGAEQLLLDLVTEFSQQPLDNALLLYRGRGELADQLPAACDLFQQRKNRFSRKLSSWPRLLRLPLIGLESFYFVLWLRLLLRREKIKLLHCHMFSANLWGILATTLTSTKLIATEHTVRTRPSRKRRLLNRWLLSHADRIVAVSQEVAESIDKEQALPPGKLQVITNGVRLTDFPPQPINLRPIDNAPKLGIVGRLIPEKRIDRFLQLIAGCHQQYPNIEGIIIGSGPERQKLEQLAAELGIREHIHFLGLRQDIPDQLAALDLFINCSDREGLSLALLEAMAAGVPVIATAVGGHTKLIEDGMTGQLVRSGDQEGLRQATLALLADKPLRQQLANQAHQLIAAEYSFTKTADNWRKLYREVLDEKH